MEEFLAQIVVDYPLIAPILFMIIRSSSVIIPPIPGIVFDLPAIVIFGWVRGFIYAEMGIMLGAMLAFWVARRFREPLVKRLTSLKKVHEWETRASENKKFWTLVAIRLPTNPLFDYISYAAGLTKISPTKFFFSSLLGNIPSMFLVFYFGGASFQKGIYWTITFLVALFILWLIFGRKNFVKRIIGPRFKVRG